MFTARYCGTCVFVAAFDCCSYCVSHRFCGICMFVAALLCICGSYGMCLLLGTVVLVYIYM